jgi:molybdopterin biosynthesis enzyme MoaB
MRSEGLKKTPFSALSRGVCGVRGKTLILNLPGSPSGAVESLVAVLNLIPHALSLLEGKTEHA